MRGAARRTGGQPSLRICAASTECACVAHGGAHGARTLLECMLIPGEVGKSHRDHAAPRACAPPCTPARSPLKSSSGEQKCAATLALLATSFSRSNLGWRSLRGGGGKFPQWHGQAAWLRSGWWASCRVQVREEDLPADYLRTCLRVLGVLTCPSVTGCACVRATAWAAHAFAPPRLAAAGAPQQAWAASPAQDRPRYAKAALQRVGRPRWGGGGPANAASAPRVGPLWTTRTRAGVGVSAERGGGNLRRAEQWRNRGNKDWEAQRQERNTPAPVFALQRLLRVLAAAFLATWAYAFLSLWLPLAGSALAAAAGVVATGPWAMAVASAGGVSSLAGQAGATLSAVSAAIETSVPALGVVAPVLAAPLGLALLAGGVVRQLLVSPALFVWSSLVLAAQLAKAMCVAAGGVAAAGLGEAVRGVSVLLTSEAVGAVMLRRDVLFYLGMLLFLRTMASSLNLHQVLLNLLFYFLSSWCARRRLVCLRAGSISWLRRSTFTRCC